MEIGRVRRGNALTQEIKMSGNKKDFSQSFNQARDRRSQEQLKQLIDDIKKKGNRLIITKTYIDVIKYMYETKKDISFWQTQYFITVNTIDGKLEELTSAFLNGEMENINIAATVDEIQGLVVDIYR